MQPDESGREWPRVIRLAQQQVSVSRPPAPQRHLSAPRRSHFWCRWRSFWLAATRTWTTRCWPERARYSVPPLFQFPLEPGLCGGQHRDGHRGRAVRSIISIAERGPYCARCLLHQVGVQLCKPIAPAALLWCATWKSAGCGDLLIAARVPGGDSFFARKIIRLLASKLKSLLGSISAPLRSGRPERAKLPLSERPPGDLAIQKNSPPTSFSGPAANKSSGLFVVIVGRRPSGWPASETKWKGRFLAPARD